MRSFKRFGGFLPLAAVILLAAASLWDFTRPHPSFYGTARAPHSDALTSWLHGTLGFYFYNVSHNVLLVRPTIPVLYSSILTLTGSIAAVPWVFAGLYAATLPLVLFFFDRGGRLAVVLLAALLLTGSGALIQPMAPDSLNTDFPAFALTASGSMLALIALGALRSGGVAWGPLLAGWFMLGLAAAVRGPLMIGGPALLLLSGLHIRQSTASWRACAAITAAAAVAFAVPMTADTVLRAALGVDSQGLIAFYSFYSDPAHTLTNEAYFRFVELRPSSAEIIRNYIGFTVSSEGLQLIGTRLLERLRLDLQSLDQAGLGALVTAAWCFGLAIDAARDVGRGRTVGHAVAVALARPVRLAGLAIVAALTVAAGAAAAGSALLAVSATVVAWSLASGRRASAWFGLLYLAGVLFLAMTGTTFYDRVAHSYLFALPAALLWFLADGDLTEWQAVQRGIARATGPIAAIALATLYGANFVVPTEMKRLYDAAAKGRPDAAIKLSDDDRLDRSLYFSGGREVLYTRRDDFPVGAVRRYRAFENPNGRIGPPDEIEGLRGYNALYLNPGRFVD